MGRNLRNGFPSALLLTFLAIRSALASGPGAVDFPGAVRAALERSAAVAVARQEVLAAGEEERQARGAYLPSLLFEERFVRSDLPAEAFSLKLNQSQFTAADFAIPSLNDPSPRNDFITSVTLSQPILAPRAYLGYRIAGGEAKARELEAERTREEVVYRVLSAYLEILTAKEFLEVADRAVAEARENLRVASALERSGMGLSSDVLRAKVFLARAEAERGTTENRLRLARTSLGLAMGERDGRPVDATSPLPDLPEEGRLEERIASARRNRSDLQAFSIRVGNAEAGVSRERSGYLPEVGFAGTYRSDSEENPFDPDNRSWRVEVGLRWNLFDGLRREAAASQAVADRERAKEGYRGASDRAVFEVTRAWLGVEDASRRLSIAQASVEAAQEGARLVQARYGNQLARLVDLLDAQTALNGARADRVRARNDLTRSRAELLLASGELLGWARPKPGEPVANEPETKGERQ